jgi:2-polyprenyl-3-methyl-5-hydroxy-6-metoxy-1,4-benzoquinol methylase
MAQIIDENLELYANYLTRSRDCLICGSKVNRLWAKYGSYKAVSCSDCNFVWINPFLNDEGLDIYYQDYIGMRFKDKEKTAQRARQYELDKSFLEAFISSGRVLDVGCSGGFFLSRLGNTFEKHGIEIDAEAVSYARRNYSFGVNVECGRVEGSSFAEQSFDIVIMRGVIEHIADPVPVMEKISSLIKVDGILYIAATPDVSCFCADLYREKWNQFHPVRHLTYYSLFTLNNFLKRWHFKYQSHLHPYIETPYANPKKDYLAVREACEAKNTNNFEHIGRSKAFWGNMMNVVYRKSK